MLFRSRHAPSTLWGEDIVDAIRCDGEDLLGKVRDADGEHGDGHMEPQSHHQDEQAEPRRRDRDVYHSSIPGGFGTIEEMTELLTWSQLGLNRKPCGLINVNGYFDALLSFFDGATAAGFIKEPHRRMLLEDSTPEGLLDKLLAYEVPAVDKWMKTRSRSQPRPSRTASRPELILDNAVKL